MNEHNLIHEDLLIKLRAKLNEDKIKLWEPPYFEDNELKIESLQELSLKLSGSLNIPEETITEALKELQAHSIERSKANQEFKDTGLATLRVKVNTENGPKMVNIQMKLDNSGEELHKGIAKEIGVAVNRIKLIHGGRVIKNSPSLQEQGIKNGVLIMALVMQETPDQIKEQDSQMQTMKSTRDDITLLADMPVNVSEDEYMTIEDQSGKSVELPNSERKSLMMALALHQRGSTAAKKKDYGLALVMLLEADRVFSECNSDLLKQIDNWAVLQLDIAWCYLQLNCLQQADVMPRLNRAHEAFIKTYGDKNERLVQLKGSDGNERVLFMRLYLLRGVMAYHQNKREEAREQLKLAETEMNALKVDNESIAHLMSLGWSVDEARCGLRSSRNLAEAHTWLQNRKEQRNQFRTDRKAMIQQRQLGQCIDGTSVLPELVAALEGMGYDKEEAIKALRLGNNNASEAVRFIEEHPEKLRSSDESYETSSSESGDMEEAKIEQHILELIKMGYMREQAHIALVLAKGKISEAVDLLVNRAVCWQDSGPSTSQTQKKNRRKKKDAKKQKYEDAFKRLADSARVGDDDYLDSNLEEEETFLKVYKDLL